MTNEQKILRAIKKKKNLTLGQVRVEHNMIANDFSWRFGVFHAGELIAQNIDDELWISLGIKPTQERINWLNACCSLLDRHVKIIQVKSVNPMFLVNLSYRWDGNWKTFGKICSK